MTGKFNAALMTPEERDARKAEIETRRTELNDESILHNDKLTDLCDEYEEILVAEEDALRKAGYVKLYEVPRETWVSTSRNPESLFFFDHIDGMYSYCLSISGEVCHVSAGQFVLMHTLDLESPPRPAATPGEFRTS